MRVALPQPRAARLPRLPRSAWRRAGAALAVAVLLAGGFLWLRDSSLVRVKEVRVTGVGGFGAAAVRSALDAAARDMTTLNVDESALRAAVARYPLVRDVRASAHPPHRLEIRVVERVPVGVFVAGGSPVVVADDGVLLRGVPAEGLAEIGTRVPPGGARVGDRKTAAKVAVLVEAPPKLRRRIARVILGGHGLQARLGSGLVIRFGDGRDLAAKWTAARRVMRDPAAATATYIDVRVPERPVAGGLTEQQGGAPAAVVPQVTVAGVPATTAAAVPAAPAVAQPVP